MYVNFTSIPYTFLTVRLSLGYSLAGSPSQHGKRDALSGQPLNLLTHARRVTVYSPQIYENFILKSGEGLSIAFVVIWLAGDLCNLIGASLAGLLPTVIILAGYVRLLASLVFCSVFDVLRDSIPYVILSF